MSATATAPDHLTPTPEQINRAADVFLEVITRGLAHRREPAEVGDLVVITSVWPGSYDYEQIGYVTRMWPGGLALASVFGREVRWHNATGVPLGPRGTTLDTLARGGADAEGR